MNKEALEKAIRIRSRMETISPDIAKQYLKHNVHNRKVRQGVVETYASDMRSGQWIPTHQGIAFDVTGALIDGQHRLLAVILSGVTVALNVTRNVPSTIGRNGLSDVAPMMYPMDAIDTNRGRSVGDQLHLSHGINNANVVSAATRCLRTICAPATDKLKLTTATASAILAVYPEILEAVEATGSSHATRRGPVLATFAFAIHVHKDRVTEMLKRLVTADGLRPGQPLHAYFMLLNSGRVFTSGGDRIQLCELTANAICHELADRKIKRLKRGEDGLNQLRAAQKKDVDLIRKIIKA